MTERTKVAVHVSFTREVLAMLDKMAADDAAALGETPDRSRLLRRLVGEECSRRRVEAHVKTGRREAPPPA